MYYYPDKDDEIVRKSILVGTLKKDNLECQYYQEMFTQLNPDQNAVILDIGCGQGRTFLAVVPYFKKIFALDPDPVRIKKASIELKKISKSVEGIFINSNIQEFSTEKTFDYIMCSHVIQHIVTSELPQIFKKMHTLLKPSGKLVLLTTNWPKSKEQFVIIDPVTFQERVADEKEFNEFVIKNTPGLPTRHFTEKVLRKLFTDANFKILSLKKYHGFPETRGDNFIVAEKIE
jgi:2-polyprenyl-3-methyl-5-hydroxy-6-metoxy-1,4-benzoquinol methylase